MFRSEAYEYHAIIVVSCFYDFDCSIHGTAIVNTVLMLILKTLLATTLQVTSILLLYIDK